jgi:predicted enzyme related to lactoylglutathione lyase
LELATKDLSVDGLAIHFIPTVQKIGINFLGDLDSTLLLYILCKTIKEKNLKTKVVPIAVSNDTYGGRLADQARICIWTNINKKFPDVLEKSQWGLLPEAIEETPLSDLVFPESDLIYKKLKAFDTAATYYTLMINHWAARRYGLGAIYGARAVSEQESIGVPSRGSVQKCDYGGAVYDFIEPFSQVDKTWTLKQYKDMGIEDLYELTKISVIDKEDVVSPRGVVWFDIFTTDFPRAQKFYAETLQWNFQEVMPRYYVISRGASAVGGLYLGEKGEALRPGTVIYFRVEDLAACYAKAIDLGATQVRPLEYISAFGGSHGVFSDLDGNQIGLYSEEECS